jgi:hypothetical protein
MPDELERIADEYRCRDIAEQQTSSQALDPAYLHHLHGMEFAIADVVRVAPPRSTARGCSTSGRGAGCSPTVSASSVRARWSVST